MATIDAREFTFGIEEELFLLRADTRALVTRMPAAFLTACRQQHGDAIGCELLQSQVEITSPVFADGAVARREMTALRRGLVREAAAQGMAVVAAGTCPLAYWRGQNVTDSAHYARLEDDYQILSQRNLICGLHVHVGVPAGIDRVRLMNRLMPWLPLFLALSASSPFWNRRRTGLHSYRQSAYDEWPRTGIPDFFEDQAAYDVFADMLVDSGAIDSPASLWWAIRPSARFPTLELRIADSCTWLQDSLVLAALYRCLVHAHVADPTLGDARDSATRRLIDENRWRARRYGIAAGFIAADGRLRPLRAWIDAAAPWLGVSARALGESDLIERVHALLERGSSADAQLAIYHRRRQAGQRRLDALHGVLDWLLEASVPAAAQ